MVITTWRKIDPAMAKRRAAAYSLYDEPEGFVEWEFFKG
jgi:hypothetical protein